MDRYAIIDKHLIIEDNSLHLAIREPFDPKMLPNDPFSEKASCTVSTNDLGYSAAYFIDSDRFIGQYRRYYPSKQVQYECFYHEGLLHGPVTSWNDLGSIVSKSWYVLGRLQGIAYDYYPNDVCYAKKPYKDGLKEGLHLYYYENGTIKSSLPYLQDALDGEVLLYHENGQLKRKIVFKEGKKAGTDSQWSLSGQTLEEGFYNGHIRYGTFTRWFDSGALREKLLYHPGFNEVCDIKRFDEKGNLLIEGHFNVSNKRYCFTEYDGLGSVVKKQYGVYCNDKLVFEE